MVDFQGLRLKVHHFNRETSNLATLENGYFMLNTIGGASFSFPIAVESDLQTAMALLSQYWEVKAQEEL